MNQRAEAAAAARQGSREGGVVVAFPRERMRAPSVAADREAFAAVAAAVDEQLAIRPDLTPAGRCALARLCRQLHAAAR